MASILYKDGKMARVKYERLQNHLDAGWTTSPAPTEDQADTNNSGKLSAKEVREAAKEAGIENWETARIKTLKEALGYGDER